MKQLSIQDLLTLHAYGDTTCEQREFLAEELATNASLHEELLELIRTKQQLNAQTKSPSATSLRIVMEHSRQTEHLQEI